MSVRETDGSQKILIATHDGMAVVFDENDVRPMGRSAMGVRGIRLREGDYVVGAARAREGKSVLTITEKGLRQADAGGGVPHHQPRRPWHQELPDHRKDRQDWWASRWWTAPRTCC